jgi:hypothetical protein
MYEIEIDAESPSARTEPRILTPVVSWHPERGWLCAVTGHHVQPCVHTENLVPLKSTRWRQ